MSPKPVLVSGRKLVKIFKKLGYEKVAQKGSHIKLKNYATGSVVIIPDHKELDRWTLKTILKQAEISDEDFNTKLR
ncbi:MAG: type II toxin-antitoxin system HicA family toxin [Proteobacteria bacterium]|nr:type II toxin-antitoxin system HicA family toxin [Pseudomonadota bacterium]MBU1585142.1 type II toxin-antitoxin system HicA family toxin [Pseudomonadota bacterium]